MKEELEKLGYMIKTNNLKGGTEYTYNNSNERPYLLCIINNSIDVIFESKLSKKSLHFDTFDIFLQWHNGYNK
jgi:hypothetical protein